MSTDKDTGKPDSSDATTSSPSASEARGTGTKTAMEAEAQRLAAEAAAKKAVEAKTSGTAIGKIKTAKVPADQAKDGGGPLKDAPPDMKKAPSARFPLILGTIASVILVGGFGGWAAFTNISGAIIATGQIQVEQNRQVVQHLYGGVVDDLLVEEGDIVEEGSVLIQLDPTDISSELAIVEGQLFEYMARIGRVTAERDNVTEIKYHPLLLESAERPEVKDLMEGQERLFHARAESVAKEVEQLGKRREQIESQIDGIDAQRVALGEQLSIIEEELADLTALLERGNVQKARVLSLQREQARLSGSIGELTASLAQAEGRITEIELEINRLETNRREEAISRLRDLQTNQLQLLEQRRSLADRMARLDIRAPVSGVIYGLAVNTPQSVIRPAEPVLYLVPQDRPLIIAAQVDPIHVDQVYVGQEVTLRFSALDTRLTPELFGTVMQVSADSFTDERTGAPYYRAEIRLNDGEIEKIGDQLILPGMPVEAYIRTEDRTPLAYLVKPLADYFNKAFRES